jgi:3',5'-cyclic AMP phosphodiesterase CpdA
MFRLAHLSDPHLGSLPRPRLSELAGKRALGFFNWHRKRRALHQEDVLAQLILDMRSFKPDHLAITGDLINLSLEKEFRRAPGSRRSARRTTSPWCRAITMPMSAPPPSTPAGTGASS